jgi:hypothetical protein
MEFAMPLRAVVSFIPAAMIVASLTAPVAARLMTRAEFMPICAKPVHGPTPAQVKMGCACAYDQALMSVPLADVRDIIHEGYREHGGLAVQIAKVPEAKRGLVIDTIKEVQQQIIDCIADAAENKLNPDGTEKK